MRVFLLSVYINCSISSSSSSGGRNTSIHGKWAETVGGSHAHWLAFLTYRTHDESDEIRVFAVSPIRRCSVYLCPVELYGIDHEGSGGRGYGVYAATPVGMWLGFSLLERDILSCFVWKPALHTLGACSLSVNFHNFAVFRRLDTVDALPLPPPTPLVASTLWTIDEWLFVFLGLLHFASYSYAMWSKYPPSLIVYWGEIRRGLRRREVI